MASTITGCDVASPYQDSWKPSSTYKFVFVKASQNTGYKNPQRAAKLKLARAAGMVVGHYHWMGAGSLSSQLANFVSAADVKAGELIAIDWEEVGVTSAEKDQFIKSVKAKYPKNKVGLYCNTNAWNNLDKSGYFGDFLWIAWYSSTQPPISTNWTFWQYSQGGGLDKNKAKFSSQAALKAWAGGTPTPSPTTSAVVTATADGIALPAYKLSGTRIKWRPLYHNNNVAANSTCFCVTQAIAVAEAKLIKLGVIKESLDFWQFGYGQAAAASADTHAAGGVVDVVQIDAVTLKVLREVGFNAAWYRGPGAAHGNFSTKHIHAVLSGCPHVSGGAASQITQVRNGQNGLANHAKDDGPKVAYITWKDAFKKFVKTPASKPAAPAVTPPAAEKDEGVLGMTDRISFRNTKAQKITKADTLQWLRIDNDAHVSVVFGPSKMMANLTLVVSGMKPTDSLYVEVATWDVKAGKATRIGGDDQIRVTGNASGWVSTRIPFDAFLGSKNKGMDYKALRIRVKSNKAGVVIQRADIAGWEG